MDFKKDIETVLESLESKGLDRATIEEKLGYSENYLDQALSRGGNKKVLKGLENLLQNTIVQKGKEINQDNKASTNEMKKDEPKPPENKKDHRYDDLVIIAKNNSELAKSNADAVKFSAEAALLREKNLERLAAMLERRSSSDLEKSASNLQNYSGLVRVIREIGIKAGYWKDQDTAEKELNRFVALHKL